ncbi:SDR family NAD(P)-dependent oxidoreductase [Brevibacterium sp. 50QC2O2]|uniref:SDR family NAD(P)-dependent oxidoreductase n=1 Tax=Brevibacterium TaxID=1696 RepID=UPI00211B900F|nr:MULTISPECIES: SDR family NAD(P)-dependent oxidoreductase [unclassified Brevibacterium]MCQ9384681.1 SDR family NAD(P)-dependent oxidoreductase [Brevibacterium sp. 68QC2CO]MCQ9389267.1 SDR family NAD(P)-dependent oxidoreductase [Brevibacterium sp. 50QC2O2]
MTMSLSTPRTWLITGAGRGLGRAFAEAAAANGDNVVGTVRARGALDDLVRDHPDTAAEVVLDVRDATDVQNAINCAAKIFGGLNIVVNNAGTGFVGALEEVTESEARDHLDLNLFGAMWVSRAAIPHLRASGGGDLVQISTVGAIGSMPMFGLYNAGKWGLEGFSEALAAEVAPFGIYVTIAQLGGFATDWAGSSMPFAHPLDQYDSQRTAAFGTSEIPWPHNDAAASAQDADPRIAARALTEHLRRPERPMRVLIGNDASELATMAYAARRDSYGTNRGFEWPS